MSEEKKLGNKIEELTEAVKQALVKEKPKGMGFPFKMKTHLTRGRLRKGYVVVMEIDDNKHVNFKKEPIIDGVIKLGDTHHAVRNFDIFLFKNKPLIIQPKKKLNPWNPLSVKNQTYGQRYVMARMVGDTIKQKMKLNLGAILIGLAVIGGIIYFVSKGGI